MNAFKHVIHILNTDLKSSTKTMQMAKDQHCYWASVLKKIQKKNLQEIYHLSQLSIIDMY